MADGPLYTNSLSSSGFRIECAAIYRRIPIISLSLDHLLPPCSWSFCVDLHNLYSLIESVMSRIPGQGSSSTSVGSGIFRVINPSGLGSKLRWTGLWFFFPTLGVEGETWLCCNMLIYRVPFWSANWKIRCPFLLWTNKIISCSTAERISNAERKKKSHAFRRALFKFSPSER